MVVCHIVDMENEIMNTEAFESVKQGLKEAIEHAKMARKGDAARALFQKWIDESIVVVP